MSFAMIIATDARADDWHVEVGGTQLAFSPMTLNIHAGDTVIFTNFGGLHNVVADDGSFRCARGCDGDGLGGNGSPSDSIWVSTVFFPNAGSYGYFCEIHGAPGVGMWGTINVTTVVSTPPVVLRAPTLTVGANYLLALVLAVASLLSNKKFRETLGHPKNLR